MREILFRGKLANRSEWVEGFFVLLQLVNYDRREPLITDKDTGKSYEVDPVTVGQYTGLMDKNGKRIFEGDIVKYLDYSMVVIWYEEHSAFALAFSVDGNYYETISKADTYLEVIGNIHDNPKFLGGENDG